MGMVVGTNTTAINANNALNRNNSAVGKSIAKLSSGMKINKAADDASGLAISEKMKAQIKALNTASANAADGQSMIQTSEGYMTEVHSMLNRMVELAEKSANGTYETVDAGIDAETYGAAGTDRQALQDEMDQLTAEIDRIADTANFNGVKLFNGNLDNDATTVGNTAGVSDTSSGSAPTGYKITIGDTGIDSAGGASIEDDKYYVLSADGGAKPVADANMTLTKGSELDDISGIGTKKYYEASLAVSGTINDGEVYVETNTGNTLTTKKYTAAGAGGGEEAAAGAGHALKLQIGETSSATDKLEVNLQSLYTKDLFTTGEAGDLTALDAGGTFKVAVANTSDTAQNAGLGTALTINISNQDTASLAAEKLRDVINEVSSRRAELGAMQNRLDYTQNNLDTASENITAANSRIRDTDMAKEMMSYTQGNVLTQAAQAMLAQANQQPSSVLQLLQ